VIVAVYGSRNWLEPRAVASFVRGVAARYPDCILLSGGSQIGRPRRGVDWAAESVALDAGLRVVSLRPAKALPFDLPDRPSLPQTPRTPPDEADPEPLSVGERHRYYAKLAEHHAEVKRLQSVWCVTRLEMMVDLDTGWSVSVTTPLGGRYSTWAEAAKARTTIGVEMADQVVCFHDGKSPGTWWARREAERLGVPLHLR
jgi:hypothetical protein